MSLDLDIDAIVREVLAQLEQPASPRQMTAVAERPSLTARDVVVQALQQNIASTAAITPPLAQIPAPAPTTAVASVAAVSGEKPSGSPTVRLTDRVITEALLQQHLGSARQLEIHPKAILTPSARDHIRRLNIAILRSGEAGSPGHGTASSGKTYPRWKAFISAATPQVTAFIQQWLAECPYRSQELSGTGAEALRQAVAAVTRAEVAGALLLATHPERLACLANRQSGVRAAAATSPEQIGRLRTSLGPNLLVLDPAGRGLFELKQLAKAFLAGGAPTPPADWPE